MISREPTFQAAMNAWHRRIAALVCGAGLAGGWIARAEEWQHVLLAPERLSEQAVEGTFRVLPDGGPGGEAVIEFADPVHTTGSIEIDLAGIDLSGFHQLHFDLWLENDVVDITATLRGYPDAQSGRRWYVMKRFQPLGEWTDIRLDLDMDDDLSGQTFEQPEQKLIIAFQRPETASPDFGRARIHRVRLVRGPLKIGLDYRAATNRRMAEGLELVYPVSIENTSDRPLTVRLEVRPETLRHFQAAVPAEALTLAAGERTVARVRLTAGAEAASLPAGYVERAQVRAVAAELPGFDAVPIRGYRPVYLFGFVPPSPEARAGIFQRLKDQAQQMSGNVADYEGDLQWRLERPPSDVTPTHSGGFRCPECKSLLATESLFTYFCYSRDISGRCPRHHERVTIDKQHPLFRPMLSSRHGAAFGTARKLALGWLRTGDERLAKRALEILAEYQSFYRELRMVAPASTGFQSRFNSASLFERHSLEVLIDAWLVLHETGAGDPETLREIAAGLILDSLHTVNFHYYSFSASQIDMVTQALRAAVLLDRWPYAADVMGGDSGVQRILARNFNPDGVSVEGGDYATQASRQIMALAESMRGLGFVVAEERMRQIENNCRLLGYLPRPADYTMKTTVLEHTGFTVLVNGAGPTWRRATINWGSTRERGGFDHLTTEFFDADDRDLLLRTRRVMWGHPHAFLAFASFAQNIPNVDQGFISNARLNQEYLLDTPRAAGVMISDHADRPAYPDSRLTRTLLIFDGCLLVVDRFVSSAGERQIDFPLNGLAVLAVRPDGMEPFAGELGQADAYRIPHDLHTKAVRTQPFEAEWAEGDRGVKLHALGDGFQAFAGKTFMGWTARSVPRDFLMLRGRAEALTAAFLYEATHGGAPRVKTFAAAAANDGGGRPAGDGRAWAGDVTFDDGRTVRILISLDGAACRADPCAVDARTRIDVRVVP